MEPQITPNSTQIQTLNPSTKNNQTPQKSRENHMPDQKSGKNRWTQMRKPPEIEGEDEKSPDFFRKKKSVDKKRRRRKSKVNKGGVGKGKQTLIGARRPLSSP